MGAFHKWGKAAWEGKGLYRRYCGSSCQLMTSHCQGLGSPGTPDAVQPLCPAVPSRCLSCANATGGRPHLLGWENCSHDWNQELICGLLLLVWRLWLGGEEMLRRCDSFLITSGWNSGRQKSCDSMNLLNKERTGREQPARVLGEWVSVDHCKNYTMCPLEITFLEAIMVLYTKTPKCCNKKCVP